MDVDVVAEMEEDIEEEDIDIEVDMDIMVHVVVDIHVVIEIIEMDIIHLLKHQIHHQMLGNMILILQNHVFMVYIANTN